MATNAKFQDGVSVLPIARSATTINWTWSDGVAGNVGAGQTSATTYNEGGTLALTHTLTGAATVQLVAVGQIGFLIGLTGTVFVDLAATGTIVFGTTLAGSAKTELVGAGQLDLVLSVAGVATNQLVGSGQLDTTFGVAGDSTVSLSGGGVIASTVVFSCASTVMLQASGQLTCTFSLTSTESAPSLPAIDLRSPTRADSVFYTPYANTRLNSAKAQSVLGLAQL